MRRRKGGWFDDLRYRIRFEHAARQAYEELEGFKVGGRPQEVVYKLTVDVPEYERRRVEIRFYNGSRPGEPRITVDGPDASPHRYRGGALCIWEPKDDDDRRWVAGDGLRALIEAIRQHLFREAWWREYGEWLGPEVIHMPGQVKEAA
jgi:hypothetical protein